MFPPARTARYAVWASCERLGVLPPGVKTEWSDNGVTVQAAIITFNQVREYDEARAAGLVDKPKSAPRPTGRRR